MPVYQYKARGSHGDAIEGTLEAASSNSVAANLVEGGLTPIDIRPVIEKTRFSESFGDLFAPKIEISDLIQFSRQMHSLLKAGVPMFNAISALTSTCSNRTMEHTLREVAGNLESGHPLSDALGQHSNVFTVFYVSMVRVGETTGHLEDIFSHLAFYLDREKTTRDKIKSALRYPTLVISAIAVAVAVITIWVIPAFSDMFASFGAKLPLQTRILMAVSDFMVAYWPVLLTLLAAIVVGARMYVKTGTGRYRWDKLKLRLPLAGPVIYQASMARFSHLFSLSLNAAVPLITALTVVARALNNSYLEERIMGMRESIEHGKALSLTAANSGIFDSLVLQMLAIGEESGTITELLSEVADYYDREVDYSTEKLSAAIEPILTVVIGALVLIMAMGVFLPMWDLASVALR